jgi:1A family penicillin-binding protein
MPSFASIEQRRVEQSTKIYDRTGEILLYDLHQDVKRTVVPLEEMSVHIKNATIAIEDDNFYQHWGIEPSAIVRAAIANLRAGEVTQGGSTITQQVVKNTLLERRQTIARKFKEWVLAIKLERERDKDAILEMYLNEAPYGGNKYGVEEASQGFFDKPARDLSIAEAAYLAALPQAPTYYSPYGTHVGDLEARKNLVLTRMRDLNFITEEQYEAARAEAVIFQPRSEGGIEAPHFVFYVIDELRELYSEEEIQEGGLGVITTLDFTLQDTAEEIVNRYALENAEKFNAENAALTAIDPRTGDLLVMVGSRDYFDEEIDGNVNVAISDRQPGSVFKPFAYAAAIEKGYTSETIVFDVATQFSTACEPSNLTSEEGCYSPSNYDDRFRGPITLRNALAQSVNVPAVKVLYLAGIRNALELAQRMGITTLEDPDRYGLTLVLGGGEVHLLDVVSAYGVFAREGARYEPRALLRIEDRDGVVLQEFDTQSSRVLDASVARTINDMLADNAARTPAFGANSQLYFPGRDVAAKTGTTNDYRDAWIVGYTPEIVAGAWAGNNDNSSMEKRVAGFIIAPLWNEFMQAAFAELGETSSFTEPAPLPPSLKPVLRGIWRGSTVTVDQETGELATEETPEERRQEVPVGDVHSILHWVNKDNPRGAPPSNPAADGQYRLWEYGVARWRVQNAPETDGAFPGSPTGSGESTAGGAPRVSVTEPDPGERVAVDEEVRILVRARRADSDLERVDYFLGEEYLGSARAAPYSFTFTPAEDAAGASGEVTLTAVIYDADGDRSGDRVTFTIED